MSVGIPVVTSRVSSLPEVGGDVPFYVDIEKVTDIKEVAGKLKEVLLLNDEQIALLKKNSYERANSFNKYSTAKDVERTISTAVYGG